MSPVNFSATMQEKKIPTPRKVNKVVMPTGIGGMLMVTTDSVPGREIAKTIGLVMGSSAQVLGISKGLTAGLGQILGGGDVPDYNALLQTARQTALSRLMQQAAALRANAVVGLRLTTSDIGTGVAEVCAYGTAVKLNDSKD